MIHTRTGLSPTPTGSVKPPEARVVMATVPGVHVFGIIPNTVNVTEQASELFTCSSRRITVVMLGIGIFLFRFKSYTNLANAHSDRAHRTSSYVSPSSGLKGFPVRSHCEATADTANAATHCGNGRDGRQRENSLACSWSGAEILPRAIIYSPAGVAQGSNDDL